MNTIIVDNIVQKANELYAQYGADAVYFIHPFLQNLVAQYPEIRSKLFELTYEMMNYILMKDKDPVI